MLNRYLNGRKTLIESICLFSIFFVFRLVDIILEKMSDAPEDTSGGQGNAAYGNQAGSYNKGTTRLTANEQQSKGGNQCQC
jgi:hypothetical protein